MLRRSASLAAATHHPLHPRSTSPSWRTAPGPAPLLAGAGPRNLAPAAAASQVPDAGITWVLASGFTPPVDLQAPQTKKPSFKSGRRCRPPNLVQFKLTAFLVPAPGSLSRASECIDRDCQELEEYRGSRLSRRQFFVWCWFCVLAYLIFCCCCCFPKSNKGED